MSKFKNQDLHLFFSIQEEAQIKFPQQAKQFSNNLSNQTPPTYKLNFFSPIPTKPTKNKSRAFNFSPTKFINRTCDYSA